MAPFLWMRGKFGFTDATAITVVKHYASESEYSPCSIGFRYCRTFFGVKSATVLFDAGSVRFFCRNSQTNRVALFCFHRKAFFVAVKKETANNGSNNQRGLHPTAAKKHEELKAQGRTDFPKRADFSESEVIAIKSNLGPWPRALEAAGVKPVNEALMEKKRQKMIERKRKKRSARSRQEKTGKTRKKHKSLNKQKFEILREVPSEKQKGY